MRLKSLPQKMLRTIAPVLLGIVTLATPASAQTPAALWTFDAGSGTTATDSSGNNRTATLTGATWTSSAKIGAYALNLSGSSQYAQATGAAVNTTNSFTAAAWVRLNSVSGYQTILSIDGNNVSGFFLQLSGANGRFVFNRLASDSTSAASTVAAATSAPVTGTWYHVAGVYNATANTIALYINGVLQQSVTYTPKWRANGNTAIGRGRFNAGNVDFLNGSIDDARLYASALTATQVQTLFNMGAPTPDFSLSASPTSGSVAQGSSGVATLNISRLNGFTGSVAFTASGLPSGVTAGFSPSSTTGNSSTLTLTVSGSAATGTSTITITGTSGSLVRTTTFGLTVTSSGGSYYTWPAYSPAISYDYVNEYGTFNPPTQVLNDCPQVVGTYANGWWCFRYGPNKNSLVTSAAWTPMVARFNTDFAYITDTMRWPRDLRARSGYYSAVYLFGSGLCTDSASNTELGGWQSAIYYNGQNWPMVLASYYPVYSFDPACPYSDRVFQQNAMIHEGIHCINASMPGCFNSAWFHEGGNTWLQANMEGKRTGNYASMGFLSAGLAIAPFMPIECYSGWLQDGSFGGPSAQGVNMFNGSQQICTWKNLLGGTQYGECFPNALSHILGEKSIAWLWRYCSVSGRVLQDLAQAPGGLGDTQMRRLISEFRARQAFGDFGVWKTAYKQLLNNNWGVTIDQEWSPYWIDCAAWTARCYVDSAVSGSTLTPAAYTLPGWSGANQIPLTVSGSSATVTFNPIGANMRCVLVYQDTSGNIRYSTPVSSGATTIPLANVKNNVIIAVVCNTDYIYTSDSIRSVKYNYTLTLGSGVTGKAAIATQWYQ